MTIIYMRATPYSTAFKIITMLTDATKILNPRNDCPRTAFYFTTTSLSCDLNTLLLHYHAQLPILLMRMVTKFGSLKNDGLAP